MQRIVGRGERFLAMAFVKGVKQAILVAKSAIEAGDRGIGTASDLGHVHVFKTLLAQQGLGRIEQPLKALLRACLARRPDPLKGFGNRGHGQNRSLVSVLGLAYLHPASSHVDAHRSPGQATQRTQPQACLSHPWKHEFGLRALLRVISSGHVR